MCNEVYSLEEMIGHYVQAPFISLTFVYCCNISWRQSDKISGRDGFMLRRNTQQISQSTALLRVDKTDRVYTEGYDSRLEF